LIKRTAIEWPSVKNLLFGSKAKQRLEDLVTLTSEYDITEADLDGAMKGIFLLIETYRLNVTEFAKGQIRIPHAQVLERGLTSPTYAEDSPLSAQDVKILGQIAFNTNFLDMSYEILKVAEAMTKAEGDKEELKSIRSIIKTVVKFHDEQLLKKNKRTDIDIKTYQVKNLH
jgi:hypothetical protein